MTCVRPSQRKTDGTGCCNTWIGILPLEFIMSLYEGYSKSSKTNSKKYFIYEIHKIIFLHRLQKCYELDGNYVEFRKIIFVNFINKVFFRICLRTFWIPLVLSYEDRVAVVGCKTVVSIMQLRPISYIFLQMEASHLGELFLYLHGLLSYG